MELLEIEKRLAGPEHDRAFAEYDATLKSLSDRVQDALRDGVAPDEFPRVEGLADAVTVARKLLRLIPAEWLEIKRKTQ